MAKNDRNERDAAGIGPYVREMGSLTPLSTLGDWAVSKGEPDIRGWEVKTVSGRSLGSVLDLLIDRAAGEAVMVDIDVAGENRHQAIPIRVVQIDRRARVVLMDSADLEIPQIADAHPAVVVRDESLDTPDPVVSDVRRGEVSVHRPVVDEGVPLNTMEAERLAADRRRAERRRIDRMGTDT